MHIIKKLKIKKKIHFNHQFIEIIDIILFGLSISIPIILEGYYEKGKKTGIYYISNKLRLEVIKIIITKSTKVDDLLYKTIIYKNNNKDLSLHQKQKQLNVMKFI